MPTINQATNSNVPTIPCAINQANGFGRSMGPTEQRVGSMALPVITRFTEPSPAQGIGRPLSPKMG